MEEGSVSFLRELMEQPPPYSPPFSVVPVGGLNKDSCLQDVQVHIQAALRFCVHMLCEKLHTL